MKKLFFALICAFISINVFAAGPACSVGNTGQTVELSQTSDTANQRGQLNIYVEASSKLSTKANIMVDVYDGMTNIKVDTVVITIDRTYAFASKIVTGLTPNKVYYFKINRVSCN